MLCPIWGCRPGTGKTRTLSHVVRAAVRQHTAGSSCVLGVATTRVAVDTLGSELCASAQPPRLVRVGELSAAASPELRSRSLDAIVAADARAPQLAALREMHASMHAAGSKKKKITKAAMEIAKLDRTIRSDVLLQAEVILTTVIGAGALPGHFAHGQPRPTVSCIVLDEACQCTVPAALVPLMAAAQLGRNDGTMPRLVCAGDHRQLPATVVSAEARAGGLGKSILEGLIATTGRGVSLLDTQYRYVVDC